MKTPTGESRLYSMRDLAHEIAESNDPALGELPNHMRRFFENEAAIKALPPEKLDPKYLPKTVKSPE
jgi:hypothetical protein